MTDRYAIYPAVGVARVGNLDFGDPDPLNEGYFFLAPDEIGALPRDCDENGNETGGFSGFKNAAGKIKRQAQKFQVFIEGTDTEITIGSEIDGKTVESLEWTVHLANKKAEWYGFSEQKGNLLYGTANSYEAQIKANPDNPNDPEYVRLSNSNKIDEDAPDIPQAIDPPSDRHVLLIDPGPRNISGANSQVELAGENEDYPDYTVHFPLTKAEVEAQGDKFYGLREIKKLGDLITDKDGRLLVLGGLGRSQGRVPLDSYGGADTWYDDISDGSVTCTIKLQGGDTIEVEGKAWVIVGPPDFAPELVNIASWDDTMFDVGVRYKNLVPSMYAGGDYKYGDPQTQDGFLVNYERDILPIIKRISGYQWVANVQSMSAFFSNIFDFSDNSDDNKPNRKKYFDYFRPPADKTVIPGDTAPPSFPSVQYEVFDDQNKINIPSMPLNSGSNSVSNYNIKKFMALTETQHFLLKQWADGYFESTPGSIPPYPDVDLTKLNPRNRASVGNVVGLPQCPGIEVTWTTQNPAIYEDDDAYRIKHADSAGYFTNGLSVGTVVDGTITEFSRDECRTDGGVIGGVSDGCEPGDLTKRMAIPWQADFFNCTIQYVNFSLPDENKHNEGTDQKPRMVPTPPTYYSYWWPPQAPWDVLGGDHTEDAQALSGIPAGLQVNYMRGINSYGQMVNDGWSYLAFIRNQNANDANYPYFVETERDHEMFIFQDVPISSITNFEDDDDTSIQVFSLGNRTTRREKMASRMRALNLEFVEDLVTEIKIAKSYRNRAPRSGTRVRF